TTAAPAPGAFLAAYEDAFAAGAESIICFCVSSEISATYSAAVAARELLEDREVHVVDTRTLSIPQGFMALAAQEAAERGMPAEAIIAHAESLRDRTVLYAALATLRYLAMSGRVGHLAAGMGNLLNVKPILTIRNGKLDLLEKVRTQKKAWPRVIELTAQALAGCPVERMAILHVAAREDALQFEQMVRAALPCPERIMVAGLSAGLSVHAGAGLVGVCAVAAA
ncbi:MAG: DegV family protein, partial [Anaerolineales bacterium]|nr:DegV family protein [Anaerolineales bacterium]